VSKKANLLALFFLLSLYGLLITSKINLVTADLGRHLKNGEAFFESFSVPQTNFYSYTYSDFPFLNHHWASGVVFYLVKQSFGFVGLCLFFTFIGLLTLAIFFDLAVKSSRLSLAILTSVLAMPLLATRVEIRPEVFSYFLAGVFLWLLWQTQNQKINKNWLFLLPILELIWINLHLYFFLGFFLICIFFLNSLINKRGRIEPLHYIKVLAISGFLVLFNPAGLRGVLYPLQIFNNYDYRLFENQTVWFLDKLVSYPPSLYFKIVFGFLVLSWLFIIIKQRKINLVNLSLSVFFSAIAWLAVRNFTLFGYFALPLIAANFKDIVKREKENEGEFFLAASLGGVMLLGFFLLNSSYWTGRIEVGLGLKEGNSKAAEFFLENNLKGPIFNNYDNGGYLIYFLYPQEKVFVDNRPEAYPAEFFQKTYIAMQESDKRWQEVEEKYDFNTIFFYRHDLTPWGQNFLIGRIQDSAWAPVYVDDWSIIFLKRNEENKEIIKRFELPKEMFSVRK